LRATTVSASGIGALIAGRYRVEGLLGQGGMGVVWRATHVLLQQPVALKLLDVKGPRAQLAVERFLREGRAAAAVRHPNIVQILDLGLLESGVPYLAMELLEGQSLADRLQREPPLSVGDLLSIMDGVLCGLTAVHDAGLVHRDVKPDNIFLTSDASGAQVVKLLDFGLSRTASDKENSITQEGSIVGTPTYMAPEQARGRAQLDGRTDLYSLGVVLYEALTGELPFLADNAADMIAAVLTEEAAPLRLVRPELGAALSAIVQRAMERNLGKRFSTARELASALAEVAAAEPELARTALPEPHPRPSGLTSCVEHASPLLRDGALAAAAHPLELPLPGAVDGQRAHVRRRNLGLATLALALALGGGALALRAATASDRTATRPAPTVKLRESATQSSASVVSPKATVALELLGPPEQAQVTVDGVPVAGPTLALPREGKPAARPTRGATAGHSTRQRDKQPSKRGSGQPGPQAKDRLAETLDF
jgi:serine/threonine-protein kinase